MAQKKTKRGTEDTHAQREFTRRVLETVNRVTGSDFTDYRETTLERRLARRMGLRGVSSREEYLALLETDEAEVRTLFRDILINVTGFFREPESFDLLQESVFPELIARDDPDGIRIWVPGCSTGEEPYSLAIALSECLERAGALRHIQIFATDINEQHIASARAGIYPEQTSSSVSAERLARYFDKTPKGWRVRKQIREMCIFALHDLTRDPPFTRIDMVSCRNLLIYWNRAQQGRLLPLFHYSLRPGGFLLLGKAESAAQIPHLFEPIGRGTKLYKRRESATSPQVRFGPYGAHKLGVTAREVAPPLSDVFVAEADRVVAAENPEAAMLVDQHLQGLRFWGNTAPFLSLKPGEISLRVAQLVRSEMLSATMSAIEEARNRGRSAGRGPTRLADGQQVFLHVVPIGDEGRPPHFLLLFQMHERDSAIEVGTVRPPELTHELADAREELTARVAELTVTNEELTTSEEQLRDANRELQSAARRQEERNATLRELNDDLTNVLASVNLPLVVLDADGRIRMFTGAAELLLGIRSDDMGRPLSDLAAVGGFAGLTEAVGRIPGLQQEVEWTIVDSTGRPFIVRMSPYLSRGEIIDGAVLTLLDVESARREALEESTRLMEALTVIDRTLNSVLDAQQIMEAVGEVVRRAIGADSLVLYRCEHSDWVVDHAIGLDGDTVGESFAEASVPFLSQKPQPDVAFVQDISGDKAFGEALERQGGSRSLLSAQLAVRDRVFGAVTFGWRREVHPSDATFDFARGLGASVSLALENARLYRAQVNVADRLQRAMLELPDSVRGIELAAHYSAAADEAAVGGDFYDVFEMGSGLVAIVIGDVSGKGLDAAVLTALARNALRAHAIDQRDPADAFTRLNRLVHRFTAPEMFLTAFFGVLDVRSGMLTYCNAGHPPGIILRRDGGELLECTNPILGATEEWEYVSASAKLGPRDSLLLYTDGISEARRGEDLYGIERLFEFARGMSRSSPEHLVAAVMQEALDYASGHLTDDVALLAIRRSSSGQRAAVVKE